jgi:hypothetical protein
MLAVSLVMGSADIPSQDKDQNQFTIGILRGDSVIIPIGEYRDGKWLARWPKPDGFGEEKIEIASHIAIIIVAILIGIVLVKNYLLPDSKPKSNASNNTAIASNTGEVGIVGKAISLPDTNWEKNGQTLVLALSTGCHFCTESAPFYKELVQKRAKQGNIRLVAVLPQPIDDGRKY